MTAAPHSPLPSPADHHAAAAWTRARRLALLGLILLGAALLRFPALDRVPPGLWFDEALNAEDVLAVWNGGGFRMVYADVFPREPMLITLLALVERLSGPSVVAFRSLSALIGLAGILLLYGMLRRRAGAPAALAAAAVLASMRWHALFSRLIFRTLLLPLWITAIVWAAFAFRRRPTYPRAILLGALAGGGFYTYLAWYFMLPLVLGLLVWVALPHLRIWPGRRRVIAIAATALLVFLPLGVHYLRFPEHLLARPGAVSPFAGGRAGFSEIAGNGLDALLMFHWRGDHVPVQNIPHAPGLDLPQGLLMLYGLGLMLATRRRHPLTWILLAWLICGVAATVLTYTDSPNFLRTLVVTPALAAFAGIGLADLAARAWRRRRLTGALLSVGLILISTALTARDIYRRWPNDRAVWERFHGPAAQLADFARRASPGAAVFVPAPVAETRSFRFLALRAHPVIPYADLAEAFAPWGTTPATRAIVAPADRIVTGFGPAATVPPAGTIIHLFRAPDGTPWGWAMRLYETTEPDLPRF